MRIVFMGTPDFSVSSLKALYDNGYQIVGVFTQPDKPQGRKMMLTPPPVKVFAESVNLPVFQPKSVKTDESLELLKQLNPDLIAVVAYGKILPKAVLDLPKYGCVNVHASLLPRHRGASPIQWAIYSGDKVTGVCTQHMDEGIDTGNIMMSASTEITDNDNFQTLHDRLAQMGANLLVKTVEDIKNGTITETPQSEAGACYAPIITKDMGKIDFNRTAAEIDFQIRAFTPWPSAYFYIEGVRVKVINAILDGNTDSKVGTVICNKEKLSVACGGGSVISFTKIQPEGKGAMDVKAYLNGKPIELGVELC